MAKRERSLISRETRNNILVYMMHHWPGKFGKPESLMCGVPMSALKPLNKGPWSIVVGGKRRPLMRIRTDDIKFIIEPVGDNGWRLGMVRLQTIHGIRVSRRTSRNRWKDVTDDGMFDIITSRFCNQYPNGFGSDEEQTLFFDEIEFDGMMYEIKMTVRHRAGKTLFEADVQTLPRWLVGEHGVEPNTRYTDGFNQLLDRLCEDERPTGSSIVFCKGNDIVAAYAKEEAAHSCMTGRRHTDKVELYALNPDLLMLALIYGENDKDHTGSALARCLVWTREENGRQVWYPDRAYPPCSKTMSRVRTALNDYVQQTEENVLIRWFREESYISENDEYYDEEELVDDDGRDVSGDILPKMNPVFRMNLPKSMVMPYMDTLIWAQVLSDGTALFARTPNRLYPIPYELGKKHRCPYELKDGVRPITHPEEMCSTEGGWWQPRIIKCLHCEKKYNSHPVEAFNSGKNKLDGYWDVGVCESCFDEDWVRVWHELDGDGMKISWEPPVHKDDAYWSDNLSAFVKRGGRNARKYLVWWKEANEGKGDFFHRDGPAIQKKDSSLPQNETSTPGRADDDSPVPGPPDDHGGQLDPAMDRERMNPAVMAAAYGAGRVTATEIQQAYQQRAERTTTTADDLRRRWEELRRRRDELSRDMYTVRLDPAGDVVPVPCPAETVLIPRVGEVPITRLRDDLRVRIIEYEMAVVQHNIQCEVITEHVQMGRLTTLAVHNEEFSRLRYPIFSQFGFSPNEWNFACREGWTTI